MSLTLPWAAFWLALLPAALCLFNLALLRPPRAAALPSGVTLSILIPARNEAAQIEAAVHAALASRGIVFELLVMDDSSTDGTAAIVERLAVAAPRLRLVTAPPLPPGWSGKAHACWQLAQHASGSHLLFVDADVRLAPDAAARLAAHLLRRRLALVSAVPRQLMGSLGEILTVPMINLLLLGYLPIAGLRWTKLAGFGAACGQLMLVDAEAYRRVGGHGANPGTRHDGLKLARRFRACGFATDLVGGADLAGCRMYRDFTESWQGFSKNAREGMATPWALPVWTCLLAGGHLLPYALLLTLLAQADPVPAPVLGAILLSLGLRAMVTLHGRESLWTLPLHPITVAVGLAIQWAALLRGRRGGPVQWKGRVYEAG